MTTNELGKLLESKLILVSGKGGTGKSSVSAALAMLGASRGRRTVIVELDMAKPAMNPIFGVESGFVEREVAENLWVANLDWTSNLKHWIAQTVPAGRVVKHLLANRLIRAFLDVAPGNRETVALARIGGLVEEYDLVVVDMPASGHAISLLEVPRTMMDLFDSGPIRREGERGDALLSADSTNLIFVSLPEEMVVNETVETFRRAHDVAERIHEPIIILNRASQCDISEREEQALDRLVEGEEDPDLREVQWAGRWRLELMRATREARHRLEAETTAKVLSIPWVDPGLSHRTLVDGVLGHLREMAR